MKLYFVIVTAFLFCKSSAQIKEISTVVSPSELLNAARAEDKACPKIRYYSQIIDEHANSEEAKIAQNEIKAPEKEVLSFIKSTYTKKGQSIVGPEENFLKIQSVIKEQQERCTSDALAPEYDKALETLRNAHESRRPPVDIISYQYDNYRYNLYGEIMARNNTDAEIDAFEYVWICRDAYGRGFKRVFMWQGAVDGDSFKPQEVVKVRRSIDICTDTAETNTFALNYKHAGGKVRQVKIR